MVSNELPLARGCCPLLSLSLPMFMYSLPSREREKRVGRRRRCNARRNDGQNGLKYCISAKRMQKIPITLQNTKLKLNLKLKLKYAI